MIGNANELNDSFPGRHPEFVGKFCGTQYKNLGYFF